MYHALKGEKVVKQIDNFRHTTACGWYKGGTRVLQGWYKGVTSAF
jgi:hypothetical protein